MKARFTYWKEKDGRYRGYLNDYPDHWTQGDDLDDLKEHLKDHSGRIPPVIECEGTSGT